jgi:hypothetical protein
MGKEAYMEEILTKFRLVNLKEESHWGYLVIKERKY